MQRLISSVGVSSIVDKVPEALVPTVSTIRCPVENGAQVGEKDFLLIDGSPEDTKDVQNAIAS